MHPTNKTIFKRQIKIGNCFGTQRMEHDINIPMGFSVVQLDLPTQFVQLCLTLQNFCVQFPLYREALFK